MARIPAEQLERSRAEWAGLVISLLFLRTADLWACMLAHALIDSVGILLAPAVMAARLRRGSVQKIR